MSFYKNLICLFTLSILLSCGGDKDDPEPIPEPEPEPENTEFAVEIGDSEIPYIVINTNNLQILNEPKVPATMDIYINKSRVHYLHIGIEYRGSTSFRLSDKKSFGIETWDEEGNDQDVSIFGFPEEEDWILMGHVVNLDDQYIFDRTLMYHYLGYELSRDMNRYASRTKFVELEVNNIYQGVYVFMEKLKRDNDRIDIQNLEPTDNDESSISGGYILKIDKTSGGDLNLNEPPEYFEDNWADDARYSEDISFRSQYDIFGQILTFEAFREPFHSEMYLETYFLYEYPKAEFISDQQRSFIQNYIHQFETALLQDDFDSDDRTYTDYIDTDSFVDFFILNELCRNVDGYRLSTYLTKDRGGKLNMGPIWDLNIGFDSGDRVPLNGWVINYNQYVAEDAWMMPFWWPRLLEDPIFRTAVNNRWNQLRANVLSDAGLINLVTATSNYLIDNGAIARNYAIWDIGGVDYQASIEQLKSYLMDRAAWMDGEINAF